MATLLRPPLVFQPQRKRPIGAVDFFSRPLTLGINPNAQIAQLDQPATPRKRQVYVDVFPNLLESTLSNEVQFRPPLSAEQVDDSATPRKRAVLFDLYPNLLGTTLAPTAVLGLPQLIEQLDDSVPTRQRKTVQVDVYPNLSATTLAPAAATLDLPLLAIRWFETAPLVKPAVRVDQPLQRQIWLDPVPQVLRLDAAATPRKKQVQVDAYPNTLLLGINPNAVPLTLDQSAPRPKFAVQVDAYPNLAISTLLSIVTVPNVVGESQAQATTDIQALGLTVTVSTDYSDTVAAGLVISQVPAAGTSVPGGSSVAIVISLGVQVRSADAGRKTRRRFFIEIDDQTFEVADAQHAQALLERAREVARAHAQELATQALQSTRRVGKKPVALPTPRIVSPDPELKEVIQQARRSINEIYRTAAIDTELALLLARKLAEEDDEEILLLM